MTVDFEEYYQGILSIDPATYNSWPGRIEYTGDKILKLLSDFGVTATFFVSGHVAERYPALVRRVYQAGHEIASHGFRHGLIYSMTPDSFRQDLVRTSEAISACTGGAAPVGYRAPWWSVSEKNPWVWEVLDGLGFLYDSSVYPVRMLYYGMPNAPRTPYRIPGTDLLEIPPATVKIMGQSLAMAGGFFWRHYPLSFIRWGIKRLDREGIHAVCLCHPWEFDLEQPAVEGISMVQRLIHYSARGRLEKKIRRLLSEFSFASIREVFFPDSQKPNNRAEK